MARQFWRTITNLGISSADSHNDKFFAKVFNQFIAISNIVAIFFSIFFAANGHWLKFQPAILFFILTSIILVLQYYKYSRITPGFFVAICCLATFRRIVFVMDGPQTFFELYFIIALIFFFISPKYRIYYVAIPVFTIIGAFIERYVVEGADFLTLAYQPMLVATTFLILYTTFLFIFFNELFKLRFKIEEQRLLLNKAQELAKMGSFAINYESSKLSVTEQMKAMLNQNTPLKSFGKPFEQILPTDIYNQLNHINSSFHLKTDINRIYQKQIDSQSKWFKLIIHEMLNDHAKPFKLQGIIQDISDQKEIEQLELQSIELQRLNNDLRQLNLELQRSNADLKNFASAASHDLQEPLRTIGSFVQLLEMENEEKLDEDSKEYMSLITEAVQRMSTLIQAILTYSKVGKKEFIFKKVRPKAIIDQNIQDLSVKIQERNAEIILQPLPDTIMAEPTQLSIVFYNLINNGIKFNTSEKPAVEIDCQERDGDYLFSIKDNGIGIDPKNHEKIFEIFKRLHRKEEYKGTGIGLASVRQIVEKHGGEIWLESELGKGTTFFFTIPKI